MNLFVTDRDPSKAAQYLDDIRLNKMITESCQMLVMALAMHGLPKDKIPLTKAGTPYKTKGHANHPVTQWTARNRSNFRWHLEYLMWTLDEYQYRTGKERDGSRIAYLAHDRDILIPAGDLEPFQNSSLYQTTQFQGVVECYRQTMIDKWTTDKIKVKWTKRKPPTWAVRTKEINGIYYRFTEKEEAEIEQDLLGLASPL